MCVCVIDVVCGVVCDWFLFVCVYSLGGEIV